jgi:NADH pyrophosphatase NudC (nudix superfamily)
MTTRTRVSLLAMMIAATPVGLAAQGAGDRGPADRSPTYGARSAAPAGMLLRYQEELSLSSEQTATLRAIQARVAEQNRPLREQLRSHLPAMRGEGMRLWRGAPPRDTAALTPEQREELRERTALRRGGLSPEQREALRERAARSGADPIPEQREALRDRWRQRAEGMTPEQRARMRAEVENRAGEARPILEQIRANSMAAAAEAREVLTLEQRHRFMELVREQAAERRGSAAYPFFRRGTGGPRS